MHDDAAPDKAAPERADGAGAQSVDRALALLAMIARGGGRGMAMGALTGASGLSRPTVRRLLLSLMRAGLVHQQPKDRSYRLGPEAYVIGLMAQRGMDILDIAMDSLTALSAQSGDTSFLTVRRGSRSVCLHREDGDFPIRTQALQAGDRHPLGVGAGAMAIFAALPPAEREAMIEEIAPILAQSHPAYTPDVLRAHAVLTNERGWSLNPGLTIAGSWAVGVALFAPGGAVIGALSIAAIESRMGPERQLALAAMLKREAAGAEARLRRRLDFDGVA